MKGHVLAEIQDQLALKSKTEFILNILIFADFSRWQQPDLDKLIGRFEEILTNSHEQNRIVFTYNPILTICLAC